MVTGGTDPDPQPSTQRGVSEPGATGGDAAGARARRTPYELVFASDGFEGQIFPKIHREAEVRGVDPLHLERFGFLSVAADAIRGLVPPEAPPEALEQHRALLFHAFNFWRYGKRLFLLEPAAARYLVEAAPALGDWEFSLPHPSVYVQLPPNLFWGSISPDSTPEPVDGFFAAVTDAEDGLGRPFQRLEVLVVLGIRRDRAGFSVIPFDTEVGPGIAAVWASAEGREEGQDFQNILPGGELSGLYSILTTAEVLKLLARSFWYVDLFPESVSLEATPERDGEQGAPPRARLPFSRISLGGPDGRG